MLKETKSVLLIFLLLPLLGRLLVTGVTASQVIHAPILIVGNQGFTAENGVVRGSGNISDPYIIEGWEIESSDTHGIEIIDTNAYFIIRYVSISECDGDGIHLQGVTNARIEDSMINNNYRGIYLVDANNNIITNNSVSNNVKTGILLESSNNNTVENNTVAHNRGEFGVGLEIGCKNNIIVGNMVLNNGGVGIAVATSYNIAVTNNVVLYNSEGVAVSTWSSGILANNNVSYNQIGIRLSEITSVKVTGNIVAKNTNVGILLELSPHNVMAGNIVLQNGGDGIQLWFSYYNILDEDTVTLNTGNGIYLHASLNVTISNSRIVNSRLADLYLEDRSSAAALHTTYVNLKNDTYSFLTKRILDTEKDEIPNAYILDTDKDGIPDTWEIKHGLNPLDPSDASLPYVNASLPYGNGLTNLEEYRLEHPEHHDPILILSNKDFTVENGVKGGSGTSLDPYIIEGWEIDSGYTGYGIVILSTDAYFMIRNVTVHGGGENGILLSGVSNGIINGSLIAQNKYGIVVDGCSGIEILNNTVTQNTYGGVIFAGGINNTLDDSNVTKNGDGLVLFKSSSNTINHSNFLNNTANGICLLQASDYNLIYNNNVSLNIEDGVRIDQTLNDTLEKNTITMNRMNGVYIYSSGEVMISNTLIKSSGVADLHLEARSHAEATNITLVTLKLGVNCTLRVFSHYNTSLTAVTVSVGEITENSLKLTWTQSSDSNFVKYEIFLSTTMDDIGRSIANIDNKANTSLTISSLTPETTYYFTVRVWNTEGLYADSNQISTVLPIAIPIWRQLWLVEYTIGVIILSTLVVLIRRRKSSLTSITPKNNKENGQTKQLRQLKKENSKTSTNDIILMSQATILNRGIKIMIIMGCLRPHSIDLFTGTITGKCGIENN
jgi:parallel beta-helix repeat protein